MENPDQIQVFRDLILIVTQTAEFPLPAAAEEGLDALPRKSPPSSVRNQADRAERIPA